MIIWKRNQSWHVDISILIALISIWQFILVYPNILNPVFSPTCLNLHTSWSAIYAEGNLRYKQGMWVVSLNKVVLGKVNMCQVFGFAE